MTFPLSIKTILSAICSKSVVIWVENKILLFSSWINFKNKSKTSLRITGSNPLVGSSSIKSFGWCDNAVIISTFFSYP